MNEENVNKDEEEFIPKDEKTKEMLMVLAGFAEGNDQALAENKENGNLIENAQEIHDKVNDALLDVMYIISYAPSMKELTRLVFLGILATSFINKSNLHYFNKDFAEAFDKSVDVLKKYADIVHRDLSAYKKFCDEKDAKEHKEETYVRDEKGIGDGR